QNGNKPSTGDLDGKTVNIGHNVTIQNNNLKLKGNSQLQVTNGSLTFNNGDFLIEEGAAYFQNSDLTTAEGGNVKVEKAEAKLIARGGTFTIGQNLQNSEGLMVLENICLTVYEVLDNSKGLDSLINVCAKIGVNTSGNFANYSESTMYIRDSEFELPNGNFQNASSASISGPNNVVWLKNGNFQNDGNWSLDISQYCVSGQVTVSSQYLPNGEDCSNIADNFTPCDCAGAGANEGAGANPTDVAKNYNLFAEDGVTIKGGESEGPIAMGGTLTVDGTYNVGGNSAGDFVASGENKPIALYVGGGITFSGGNGINVLNNSFMKLGNATGLNIHDFDQNGATANTRINTGNFDKNPKISLSTHQTAASIQNAGLIDFGAGFTEFRSIATQLSQLSANTTPTIENGTRAKINLTANQVNVINWTGSELTALNELIFQNKPSSTQPLIINIDASGTLSWQPPNFAAIGDAEGKYILLNFYNTTDLTITGGTTINGTVLIPNGHFYKNNSGNINGQVIAKSFAMTGGELHHYVFDVTIPSLRPASATPSSSSNSAVANDGCDETIVFIARDAGKIEEFNITTGVGTIATTSPYTSGNLNSLAANPDAKIVYYARNKKVYYWEPATDEHGQLVNLSSVLGSNESFSSGAGAYYNGYVYMGAEDDNTSLSPTVYRVPVSADGMSTSGAAVKLDIPIADWSSWGDMIVTEEKGRTVIFGGLGAGSANNYKSIYFKYYVEDDIYTMVSRDLPNEIQLAVDVHGDMWAVGANETALQKVNRKTGAGYGNIVTMSGIIWDMTGPFNCAQKVEICGNGIDDDGDGLIDNADDECKTLVSRGTDCSKTIPSSGSSNHVITSVINIPESGAIEDINIVSLDIRHSYIDDLKIYLIGPDGTSVLVMDKPCNSQNDIFVTLDDESTISSFTCPPIDGRNYKPSNPLSAFDGKEINGDWTLRVEDVYPSDDGGTFNCWALEFETVHVPEAEICDNGIDDDGDGDVDCDDADCNCDAATPAITEVWLEAECATIGSNWETKSDGNATNGTYARVKSGKNSTGNAPTGAADRVSFTFELASAGDYSIFGRVITPSGTDDSFWVRANGGTWYKWNDIDGNNSWSWQQVHDADNGKADVAFPLSAGENTVDIAYREDGALLDKIVVTNAATAPTGEGGAAGNCTVAEICDNDIDDDNDGLTDKEDPDCSCNTAGIPNINFDKDTNGQPLSAGANPSETYAAWGIHITSDVPSSRPVMIFDSGNITGGDKDLGTPNQDFGGPGHGSGGRT
ncbi:MAG: collagen-binding domain-containing protein, partial [Bacteroidota bacterium]